MSQFQANVSHDVTDEAHHHPPHQFVYHWMLHCTETEFDLWNSQSLLQIRNWCSKGFCILYSWYKKCPTVCLTLWYYDFQTEWDTRLKTSKTNLGWKSPECPRHRKIAKALTKDDPKKTKSLTYLAYWLKSIQTGPKMNKCAPNWYIYSSLPKARPKIDRTVLQIWDKYSKGFRMSYSWCGECPTVYLTTENWYNLQTE